jgi:hypothetical protein
VVCPTPGSYLDGERNKLVVLHRIRDASASHAEPVEVLVAGKLLEPRPILVAKATGTDVVSQSRLMSLADIGS